MQKKSLDRSHAQKDMDRKLGIIADTSRLGPKKIMQSHFERKEEVKKELSKSNMDKDRGINLHLHSAAKYRDGALNLTKEGIRKIEGDESTDKRRTGPKKRKTYDDIQKVREDNPEYMTGKKFKKKRGNVGKKFKTKKGGRKY